MHLLGRSNWWLPRGMDRRLPQLHVEGRSDTFLRPIDGRPIDGRPIDDRELVPSR
jgi:RND superfamily putative drug exporter